MELLDQVPVREPETLFDRLEYCRWTLQKHGILDVFHSSFTLRTLKNRGKKEGVVMGDFQHE